MTDTFDYVIVGSGPAGSLLADRLTEDRDATVCVLEAGVADRHPYVRIPAGFVKLLYDPALLWEFETEPGDAIAGRRLRLPQGRIVGGSSAINGLAYSRGQAGDFDDWAAAGNAGWSYREVLPYFKRSERRIGDGDVPRTVEPTRSGPIDRSLPRQSARGGPAVAIHRPTAAAARSLSDLSRADSRGWQWVRF